MVDHDGLCCRWEKVVDECMPFSVTGFFWKEENDTFSFGFQNTRFTDEIFVSTEGGSMLMMDKYNQIDLSLSSQRMFGLGQRDHTFELTEGTWTMWASGRISESDDGTGG